MRFVMDGKMPEYLHAKDLILQVRMPSHLLWPCLLSPAC